MKSLVAAVALAFAGCASYIEPASGDRIVGVSEALEAKVSRAAVFSQAEREAFLNDPQNVNKLAEFLLMKDFYRSPVGEAVGVVFPDVKEGVRIEEVKYEHDLAASLMAAREGNPTKEDIGKLMSRLRRFPLGGVLDEVEHFLEAHPKEHAARLYFLDLLEDSVDGMANPGNMKSANVSLLVFHTHPTVAEHPQLSNNDMEGGHYNAIGYFAGKLVLISYNTAAGVEWRRWYDITKKELRFLLNVESAKIHAKGDAVYRVKTETGEGPWQFDTNMKHAFMHFDMASSERHIANVDKDIANALLGEAASIMLNSLYHRFQYVEFHTGNPLEIRVYVDYLQELQRFIQRDGLKVNEDAERDKYLAGVLELYKKEQERRRLPLPEDVPAGEKPK